VRSCSGLAPAQPIVGDRIGLMTPDRQSPVQIEGEADVFQVFVDRSVIDDAADHRFDCESALDIYDQDLLAATVTLFVSARRDGPDDDLSRQTNLWLLVSSSTDTKFMKSSSSRCILLGSSSSGIPICDLSKSRIYRILLRIHSLSGVDLDRADFNSTR
jgi:hypothetical protein